MNPTRHMILIVIFCALAWNSLAAQDQSGVRENQNQVRVWNDFVDSLLRTHRYWIGTRTVRSEERIGGYARHPRFFREIETRHVATDRLLSRLRWERERPDRLHVIEIFHYDARGRLSVDYAAAFLIRFRNAPFQTLVNIHAYSDTLHAYRQFDASGDVILERCEGDHEGAVVDLTLDEPIGPPPPERVAPELYAACFGAIPITADGFLRPENLVAGLKGTRGAGPTGGDLETVADLEELNLRIAQNPNAAGLLLRRGKLLLTLQRFDEAARDFDRVLSIDDRHDAAYFGRGIALGRLGKLDRAIADLTVYIDRNPDSSIAYTKRGVRQIWAGRFERAEEDLTKAIALDAANTEALDDLGVVLARTGRLDAALAYLLRARALDPTYTKVHHNIAIAYFMKGDKKRALAAAEDALRLDTDVRSTLMLKAVILESMGRNDEASKIKKRAQALPKGDWSERVEVR